MSEPQRHALVTGASSGIGAAIVERLLHDGWSVTGVSRSAQPARSGYTHIALDLLQADRAAMTDALAGLRINALVHAAGVLRVGPLGALDEAAGREMWRLHVDAAVLLADLLMPQMADGDRVVLVGSRVANGAAGRSQYAASKAALVGLARSWAAEVAARGITVNIAAPGATDTPMLQDPKRLASRPRLPPTGRLVQPTEVAALVAFLLSHDARSITGQQIVVCGGASL
jgi:NAD(P)-dependent dehydrogenase (short-subunit alcohol dehydrogenase family)